MERWELTYVNRDAMLGEMPARYVTKEFEVPTDGLDEQADEETILSILDHLIEEHTAGGCVLTEAVKVQP